MKIEQTGYISFVQSIYVHERRRCGRVLYKNKYIIGSVNCLYTWELRTQQKLVKMSRDERARLQVLMGSRWLLVLWIPVRTWQNTFNDATCNRFTKSNQICRFFILYLYILWSSSTAIKILNAREIFLPQTSIFNDIFKKRPQDDKCVLKPLRNK